MTLDEALAALRTLSTDVDAPGRVQLEVADGVAHVRLDSPGTRSAVTFAMMVSLAEIVRELRDFQGHLAVLSSTDPRVFCSGGHLGQLVSRLSTPSDAERMARAMAVVLAAFRDLPVPTVAAVHGLAVGGGAEVTTAADFRWLHADARIQFIHTRLGVVPGWGGAGRLGAIVGRSVALRWLLSGDAITAPEALAAGFATEVVSGDVVEAAVAFGATFRDRNEAVRSAKAQLGSDAAGAAALFAGLWGGPAHRRALDGLGRLRK